MAKRTGTSKKLRKHIAQLEAKLTGLQATIKRTGLDVIKKAPIKGPK